MHVPKLVESGASLIALAGVALVPAAVADPVEVYSAGSLRVVVTDLAHDVQAFGIELKPSFGGSGLLRERIEHGEHPDLFLSADMGSPRTLETQGRTQVPVVAIARNRMCILSTPAAGITASNLVERLLAPGLRLRTSQPIADPGGDYAWAIFDRIEASRPGAGAALKAKAQSFTAPAATGATAAAVVAPAAAPNPVMALFAAKEVDVAISYCSGVAALRKEIPDLASLEVPPALDPHPLYGMALLSARPEAARVALYLLSEKGQALVAKAGLVPITDPGVRAP